MEREIAITQSTNFTLCNSFPYQVMVEVSHGVQAGPLQQRVGGAGVGVALDVGEGAMEASVA